MILTRVLGGLQDLLVRGFSDKNEAKQTIKVDRGSSSIDINYLNIDTLPAVGSLGEDGYISIRDYIDNNNSSSISTIVIDLNSKELTSSQFYLNNSTSSNGQWTYLLTDDNKQSLGYFITDREIVSIIKVGFNGVMYAGNVINGMSFNLDSVVNINELNASQNKIMYIEVEL